MSGRCIDEIEAWSAASEAAQEEEVAAIAAALGEDWERRGWGCWSGPRIARFGHRASGAILHLIPGGAGQLGSDETPWDFDIPVIATRIAPFLLGEAPLSQRCWDAVGGEDARAWPDPERPLEKVSVDDARAWLARAGGGLRLPSEAEWEYAARAGAAGEPDGAVAQAWGLDRSGGRTQPLDGADERRNGFGLFDLLGNVWEWCEDAFAETHAGHDGSGRPRSHAGPVGERRYVYKGCGWNARASHLRVSNRNGRGPGYRFSMIGLRLARSL